MTKYEALKLILDEKLAIDKLESINALTQWFWKVGFREILIDEDAKKITCIVSRPNQFISKFKKPIVNFLVYLTDHTFKKLGYFFELKKDTEDECYALFSKYIKQQ